MLDIIPRVTQEALDALAAMQTEIMIFTIAMCVHTVLFRKYRIKPSTAHKLKAFQDAAAPPPPRSPRRAYAAVLAREVQTSRDGCDDAEALKGQLLDRLSQFSAGSLPEVLAGLLDEVGKAVSAPLLHAIRLVMQERGVCVDSCLGELLLRGYFELQLDGDFEKVLTEVDASEVASNATRFLALKASLRSRDLEASISRLREHKELWKGQALMPSIAPYSMLRSLARLAGQKGALFDLALALHTMGLLAHSLDAVLTECMQKQDERTLNEAIRLVRSVTGAISPAAYASMIKVSATCEDALRLLEEAAHDSSGAPHVVPGEVLLAAAGHAVACGDRVLGAAVLRHLPVKPPAELVCLLLRLHVERRGAGAEEQGEDDSTDAAVLEVYERHFAGADLSGDPATELRVVEVAARNGRSDLLEKLLAAPHCDTTRQAAILTGFGGSGRVGGRRGDRSGQPLMQRALAIFRACHSKTAVLYNVLLDMCVKCRDSDVAAQIMEEALEAECADIVTYNTMVKVYLTVSSFTQARKFVETMRVAGFEPNRVTFNEFIDAHIKEQGEVPWNIVAEMKACGVKPDNITCSILLKSIQTKPKHAVIERIMEVLDDPGVDMDEVLLGAVIDACIRAGRPDLLVPVLKKQGTSQRVELRSAHTYGSIIRACGFVHDIPGVWETWRDMRMRHITPTSITLGCMVEALISNGDSEAGYELICNLHADEQCCSLVNAVIYCSVLKGFSHQKKFDRVWSVYQEMLTQKEKIQFSIVTFNTLVDACARCREMHRIPAILEDMVAQGIEPNIITHSAIIKGYCQEGRLDSALELMDTMRQSDNTAFRPDEITYNTLLDGCARQNMYDRGMQLLEEMQEAGVQPTNFTLSVLVKVAIRGNKLDKAFELCEQLSYKYNFKLNVHVFANLMQGCVTKKNFPRALDVFTRMINERVRPDIRTYTIIVKAALIAGEAEHAAGLLRASVGLPNVLPELAGLDGRLLQPQPRMTAKAVSEIVEGIVAQCADDRLVATLIRDVRRLSWVKLDPKLQLLLAARVTRAAEST